MNCFGQPWRQILFFIGREKKFIEFQKSWREGATNHPDKLALKTRGEGEKGSQSNEGFLNFFMNSFVKSNQCRAYIPGTDRSVVYVIATSKSLSTRYYRSSSLSSHERVRFDLFD